MNFLKGFISSLITIILVPIIMVFIVYLSTRNIVSRDGIKDLFKSVELSDFLIDNKGEYTEFGSKIKEDLVNYGVPAEVVDEFVNSEQISDFFSDYTGDALSYIIFDEDIDDLKSEDISKLINDNIDDIVADLKEKKVDGYEELTDERVNQIKSEVNNLADKIETELPNLKKYVNDSNASTAIKIVRIIFSKAVVMIFIAVIAILALLIVLLNLKNFRYGIWLGVILIVSSIPLLVIGNANINVNITDVEFSKAIEDIVKFALENVSKTSLLFFIIGVVLIVLTIIARIIKKHCGKKGGNEKVKVDTPVAPVAQPVEQPVETPTSVPVETSPEQSVVGEEPITNEVVAPSVFNLAPGEELKNDEPVAQDTTEVASESAPEIVTDASSDVCANCGAKLNDGQKFCYNCGTSKK